MHLKSLNIRGFKSFADNTDFVLHPGVTAIVGPNGCGKSNVVDALKWVLGETSAKALRGGEMADVIFNGTDKRKPLGMAEVVVTFADCESTFDTEFNEVSLSRRVFRDGRSEYRINDVVCRLKDIRQMLMDTGIGRSAYSIMEQGKIDLLLSSKPEDRRAVFEEAAGVTRFKAQKKEALRKLDHTEMNLDRVGLLIQETLRQRNSMERQAKKALRYQDLHSRVKVLDTHLAHRQYAELSGEKAEMETSRASLEKEEAELRHAGEELSADLHGLHHKQEQLEVEYQHLMQKKVELQNQKQSCHERVGFNKERRQDLLKRIEQNEEDISRTEQQMTEQKDELAAAEQRLVDLRKRIEERTAELGAAEENYMNLQKARQGLEDDLKQQQRLGNQIASALASLKARSAGLQTQQEANNSRLEQIGGEIAEAHAEREKSNRDENEQREALNAIRQRLGESGREVEAARAKVAECEQGQRQKQEISNQAQAAFAATQSQHDLLRAWIESGEGFSKGTQQVLQGLDEPETFRGAVRGTLGSMLAVLDESNVPVVQAALQPVLQTILMSHGELAENAIRRLREKQLGQASVVAEDTLPATRPIRYPLPSGAIARVSDLIMPDPRIDGLLTHYLTKTFMVDSLDAAKRLHREYPDATFVTRDGDLIRPGGVIIGGSASENDQAILKFRGNLERLQRELSENQNRLSEAERALESGMAAADQAREELKHAGDRVQEARIKTGQLESAAENAHKETQRITARIEALEVEQSKLGEQQNHFTSNLHSLLAEEQASNEESRRIVSRLPEIEAQMENIHQQESEASRVVHELRTSLAVEEKSMESIRERRNPLSGRLQELDAVHQRRKQEIGNYHRRIGELDIENQQLENQASDRDGELETLGRSIENVSDERQSISASVKELQQKIEASMEDRNRLQAQRGKEEVRCTQLELRIGSLSETVRERYDVDISLFEPDAHLLLSTLTEQKSGKRRKHVLPSKHREEPAENGANNAETEVPSEPQPVEPEITIEIPADLLESGPDWEEITDLVSEMRRKLDSMGPVNLDAITEFEELEESLSFKEQEREDLIQAKDNLLEVIDKLNRETRTIFAEKFEAIRNNFREMFTELFGDKAKADLLLLDEEDPLECGIDIIAKPPGKALRSISLLSGGERSMTAVALLFAIYMVKPSPFCVLDELDAPLDESNIGRFLHVLDRFVGQSQFVVITHNKRTMGRADVMYGVTMPEFGVSKLVGMKLTSDSAAAS